MSTNNIYKNAVELSQKMSDGLNLYAELIGTKDTSKSDKFDFVPGLNMLTSQEYLKSLADQINEGIFKVMFTGAFSSGKSTLLNALMRKELLQVSITPETAIITQIVFGKDEKVTVIMKQTDPKTGKHYTSEMTVKDFFEEYRVSQEDPNRFVKKVEYAILNQPGEGIGGKTTQLIDSPGTQNSAADNEIAHGFIKNASAVVFMINAVEPFSKDDKEFIAKNYAHKNMKNLFFVINRIDSVDDNQIPSLKSHVETQLREVFTKPDGTFDRDLFEKRVFYTNAYGALMARLGRPMKIMGMPIKVDESLTGVPEFENALSEFLTDGDKEKEAFNSYMVQLARIYKEAEENIEKSLEQYKMGIENLENEKSRIEASKDIYKRYIDEIAESCRNCVSAIIDDSKREYDNTIYRIDSGWTKYFSQQEISLKFTNILGILWNKATSYFKSEEEKKKAIEKQMEPFSEAIKGYINPEMAKMAENLNACITTRLNKLQQNLESISKAIDNIGGPISFEDLIKSLLAAGKSPVNVGTGEIKTSLFQMILGVIAVDPETIIGGAAGSGKSNTSVIISTILKSILEYTAWYLVYWPIGLAMLAARVIWMIKDGKANARTGALKILEGMKPDVIGSLRENKDKYVMEIENKMSPLLRGGNTVSQSFQNEFDKYNAQLNETINNLTSNTSAAADEQARTDAIKAKLLETFNSLYSAINGKTISESEIKKLI